MRGFHRRLFCEKIIEMLPSFEKGELGRILHTVAPVVRKRHDGAWVGGFVDMKELARLRRVVTLQLERAREAVACWAVVGRRSGLVKDVRVMIGKMAWEEVWLWRRKPHQKRRQQDGSGLWRKVCFSSHGCGRRMGERNQELFIYFCGR
jgi:hypothetical protein